MTWLVSDELVPVELEGCRCPGSPHDHDTVWLLPTLTAAGGLAGMHVIARTSDDPEQLEIELGRVYVEHGIARWTLVDAEGVPLPLERAVIRKLGWAATYPLAQKASELYSEDLLRPLVVQASKFSANGHTAPSTSPRRRSSSTRRKR